MCVFSCQQYMLKHTRCTVYNTHRCIHSHGAGNVLWQCCSCGYIFWQFAMHRSKHDTGFWLLQKVYDGPPKMCAVVWILDVCQSVKKFNPITINTETRLNFAPWAACHDQINTGAFYIIDSTWCTVCNTLQEEHNDICYKSLLVRALLGETFVNGMFQSLQYRGRGCPRLLCMMYIVWHQ